MKPLKIVGIIILAITSVVILSFGIGMFNLQYTRFFLPKKENVRREVFENTKAYTHGKIQDLAKYYDEYRKTDMEDRVAIESVVKMQFANFNSSSIDNAQLKSFLYSIRGY